MCARSNRVPARAYQGAKPGLGGGMHQFCAAGLEGLQGATVPGRYPALGAGFSWPSGPVSMPWRAIAGWARLVPGAGPAGMTVFTVQPYSL